MLRFEQSQFCPDIICPHCQKGIRVKWQTEYGDALPGDYNEQCPNCNKNIAFDVEVTTTFHIKANNQLFHL